MPTVRRKVKITVKRPVVRVTKSGQLFCNNCGCVNKVTVGLKDPICGRCGWRLA